MMYAVVTGGGGEIGRAVARELMLGGWGTLLVDVDQRALETACETLGPFGSCRSLVGDVADEGLAESLARALDVLGPVRGLVNNAGILGRPAPARE